MRRLFVILLMIYYSAGTLLFPIGDFSNIKNISAIYGQCKEEDPDMDAPDFIFEHLLNLGSVCEHFEGDTNEDKNEKPHQPFQQMQSLSQTLTIINAPLAFETKELPVFINARRSYALHQEDFIPSTFLTEVFHPPSA